MSPPRARDRPSVIRCPHEPHAWSLPTVRVGSRVARAARSIATGMAGSWCVAGDRRFLLASDASPVQRFASPCRQAVHGSRRVRERDGPAYLRVMSASIRASGVLLAASAVLASAGPAYGHRRTLAPPGNSAVSQYVESIPTASGSRPVSSLNSGGGSGGPGAAGGLSSGTSRSLAGNGRAGAGVLNLVRSTAPTHRASNPSWGGAFLHKQGVSPVTSVLRALTGSSSSGGLGILLPIILVTALVGAGGLALLRRRLAKNPPLRSS